MDAEFFKQLANFGAVGLLAAFMYMQNNKNNDKHAEEIRGITEEFTNKLQEYYELEKGRTQMILGVVVENTKQTTTNTEVLKSMHKRLDKDAQERS